MYETEWTDIRLARFASMMERDEFLIQHTNGLQVKAFCAGVTPVVLLDGEDEYRLLRDTAPTEFTVYRRDDEVW